MKKLFLLIILFGSLGSISFAQKNCPVIPTPVTYVLPNLDTESTLPGIPLSLGVDTTNLPENLYN